MKKIIVVTNIPNPYRIPLFNELNTQLKEKNIKLKVVFGTFTYKRRKFELNYSDIEFDYEILKSTNFSFGNIEKTLFLYTGLIRLLKREKPDKIITNGFSIGSLKIWLYSFFADIKYIVWSGTIQKKGRNDSLVRKMLRKAIISKATAFIVYGSMAKNYLISMKANPSNIFIAINTVDTEFFFEETNHIRASLIPNNISHITYIGYLSPRKNVIKLLEAIKLLSQTKKDFVFDLIGDGPDLEKLKKFTVSNNLQEFVTFHGFLQKHELPPKLAISNCFTFQTDFDIWGLVLNEAMAAGLPCIASLNAGATYDLIQEGETGYSIDFNQTTIVVAKITEILNDRNLQKKISQNASNFILNHINLQISAKGFVKAIESY